MPTQSSVFLWCHSLLFQKCHIVSCLAIFCSRFSPQPHSLAKESKLPKLSSNLPIFPVGWKMHASMLQVSSVAVMSAGLFLSWGFRD